MAMHAPPVGVRFRLQVRRLGHQAKGAAAQNSPVYIIRFQRDLMVFDLCSHEGTSCMSHLAHSARTYDIHPVVAGMQGKPLSVLRRGWCPYRAREKVVEGEQQEAVDAHQPPVLREGPADVAAARLCLLYTSPSPRDATLSRMPSSA